MDIDNRLATYGALAPGRPDRHQLADPGGRWLTGTVRGHLVSRGWAADLGYPALLLEEAGGAVPVHPFVSPDLPRHWGRLDAFEGRACRRRPVAVATDAGPPEAWIYRDADPQS